MRCQELTTRNGYYTGKRCSRQATTMVTIEVGDREDDRACCTQHANKLEAENHWRRVTRRPIDHACDNPIHCSTCLNQQAAKATARRTAAKWSRRPSVMGFAIDEDG